MWGIGLEIEIGIRIELECGGERNTVEKKDRLQQREANVRFKVNWIRNNKVYIETNRLTGDLERLEWS